MEYAGPIKQTVCRESAAPSSLAAGDRRIIFSVSRQLGTGPFSTMTHDRSIRSGVELALHAARMPHTLNAANPIEQGCTLDPTADQRARETTSSGAMKSG